MEKNKIFKKVKEKFIGLNNWIRKHPWEALFIFLILSISAFLRLYKIDKYLTFLGDEGRDAIIVRRLLVYKDLILVGPGTSIGNMYLGPLYYYMMAPALFLANYSPVGPAVQVALLGVITVFFVFLMARQWFGVKAAIVSSLLYAISPTVIIYSRSSWNPNIMPFFSLICIYSIWQVWMKFEFKWLMVFFISLAFTLQSHYLGLLLIPVFGFFYLWTLFKLRLQKKLKENNNYQNYLLKKKELVKYSFISVAFFIFLMSPLVIFDARHGWRNFSSMKKFFAERQTTVSARPWTALPKFPTVARDVTTRLLTGRNETVGGIVFVLLFIFLLFLFLKRKKLEKTEFSGYTLVLVWLFVSLIGLGLYKQEIYDHYYGFFFPAPFLLIGGFFEKILVETNKIGKAVVFLLIGFLIVVSLLDNPLKYLPNQQMQRSIRVAEKIKEEYNNQPFNLAVIAERNYEDGYQYFLEKMNLPVIDIDAQKSSETIKEQLFVVCEMPKEKCDPVHSPKAEVANFGWSEISDQWDIFGVTLYKLIHTK